MIQVFSPYLSSVGPAPSTPGKGLVRISCFTHLSVSLVWGFLNTWLI